MKRIISLIALILAPFPTLAQDLSDVARVSLLPGWRGADGRHVAALRIELAPGWKTYWRSPGDAGIPPQFDWGGSGNLSAVQVHWPVPEVFDQNGLTSVGYADAVTIPVTLTPARPGEPIDASLRLDMGVCEDVCVPVTTRVSGHLPSSGQPDREISAAMADRPLTEDEASAGRVTCTLSPTADGLRLSAELTLPPMGEPEFAVIELPDPTLWISEAETQRRGNTLIAEVDIVPPRGAPLSVDRRAMRMTVLGQRGAADIRGCD